MRKTRIRNSREKRRILDNFISEISTRHHFMLAGHRNPDEDCIASMVAFSLLLNKFAVKAVIVSRREYWDRFPYLLNICQYNAIDVVEKPEEIAAAAARCEALVVCDTPKKDMVDLLEHLQPLMDREGVPVLEIDHHMDGDSSYIGDEGLCLVDQASSSCELIGMLAFRISRSLVWKNKLEVNDLFSRNFILSIVIGIAGDSKMGQYLKAGRQKRYYRYFSRRFNKMLMQKTDRNSGNFSSLEDILTELEHLSVEESQCYKELQSYKKKEGQIAWIALDEQTMETLRAKYDNEVIVTTAKHAANELAEESRFVGMFAYYDPPDKSDLIQFRMRRSEHYKTLDLRHVIDRFHIENGGGHEGAIGFRLPRAEVENFNSFIDTLVKGTNEMIKKSGSEY